MAFLRSTSKTLPFALMLALAAGCGSEDDKPADSTDETDEVDEGDEDEGDEDSTGGKIDAGSKLDASKPPAKNDASTDKEDAGVKVDAGQPAKDAGNPTVDAGAKDAAVVDSGTKDSGTADAGKPPTPGAGVCNDKTPHGCYTPATGNPTGCPAQSPEIPTGYPSLDQWDLCNNLAVGAGATCAYNGPNGSTASCLCDTGVHWLCLYL